MVDIISPPLINPDRTLQVKEFIFPRFCISTPRLPFPSSFSTIAGGLLTTANGLDHNVVARFQVGISLDLGSSDKRSISTVDHLATDSFTSPFTS